MISFLGWLVLVLSLVMLTIILDKKYYLGFSYFIIVGASYAVITIMLASI